MVISYSIHDFTPAPPPQKDHFEFDGSKMSQRTGIRLCLPLCSIPSSYERQGAEETNCCAFWKGTLSHSCLTQDSSVRCLLCCIFRFMMPQIFIDAICGLVLSCSNMQGLKPEKGHPWEHMAFFLNTVPPVAQTFSTLSLVDRNFSR